MNGSPVPMPVDDPSPDSLVCGLCRACGEPMLSQTVWRYRPDLREQGYRRHMADGLCATDYSRAYRAGTLPEPAPPRDRKRRPKVSLRAVYTLVCEACGEFDSTERRCDAEWAMRKHSAGHRSPAPIEGARP